MKIRAQNTISAQSKLRLISSRTNGQYRDFTQPQNVYASNYLSSMNTNSLYKNNRLIATGMVSPPIMKMDQAMTPQYNHLRTITSGGYYNKNAKAKYSTGAQSVKPKMKQKQRSVNNKAKKNRHKSPQLLLRKQQRKPLLQKGKFSKKQKLNTSTLTNGNAKKQKMDEIFKGFRNKTPQQLHKQFMTRTTDYRTNPFQYKQKNSPQRNSHKTHTPARHSYKPKTTKVIKPQIQKSKTPSRYQEKIPVGYTPQRLNKDKEDKPRKKDLLSDSSDSDEDNEISEMCYKHTNKKAKYIVMGTTPTTSEYLNKFFCSRCAIKLVQKGMKVEEITEKLETEEDVEIIYPQKEIYEEDNYEYQEEKVQDDEEDVHTQEDLQQLQKRQELQLFLDNLNKNKTENEKVHSEILNKKEEMINYYDCQNQQLVDSFQKLEMVIKEIKEQSFQKLENSKMQILNEFDEIGKELIQNISDMNNIESDINQNIDKIITKIDLQDFLQILEKYSVKLCNFSKINYFLKNETTTMGKFSETTNDQLSELHSQLQELFKMSEVKAQYLDPHNQSDFEETNSIYVSFENKEIFENAIKLSKLGERDSKIIESQEQDQLEKADFKVKDQTQECEEEMVQFSHEQLEFENHEENPQYEHPMIGCRKILGDVSLNNVNNKSKTVTKADRLQGTLKKFQGQKNVENNLADTITSPQSDTKVTKFRYNGNDQRYFSIDNSPLSQLTGDQSSMRMNKYRDILSKVSASHKKKEKFYSDLLQDPQPFISPQPQIKQKNFCNTDGPFVILEDQVGEDYQSPIFKELKNQQMQKQGSKTVQSEQCKNFFQFIGKRLNEEQAVTQPKYQKTLFQ